MGNDKDKERGRGGDKETVARDEEAHRLVEAISHVPSRLLRVPDAEKTAADPGQGTAA